ncbi:MAG: C-GCAxxG-C-C family protein [Clostridiales bacterium]|nr:C-GCAxxG-C-C family protein [Clostridiales bacterium]
MSIYYERAKALRETVSPHYNCAQSVLLPFAEEAGLDRELALKLSSNFGSGMKCGSVCGAITGGLMALGLYGVEDGKTVGAYFRRLRANHENCIECAQLLRLDRDKGNTNQKAHCDGMVYECVALVEEILREQGKIGD